MNFSNINLGNAPSGIIAGPESAVRYTRDCYSQMRNLYRTSVHRWPISPRDRGLLDTITGATLYAPNQLASNLRLRASVSHRLINEFDQLATEHPERRFCLTTLFHDGWLTYDRDTYLWLGNIRAKSSDVMKLAGFDGYFGMVEVQAMSESVRDLGRILLPHVHFIAWSDSSNFKFSAAEEEMRASGLLYSRLGADTADIQVRSDTHPSNLAAYVAKAPCVAKRRAPDRMKPSGFRLDNSRLAPAAALRVLEVLSHVYLDELMIGAGDGLAIRSMLKSHISRYAKRDIDVEDVSRVWERCRKLSHTDNFYYPVAVDRRRQSEQPLDALISLEKASFLTRRHPDVIGMPAKM